MTAAAATTPSGSAAVSGGPAPAGWEQLRADGNVQFAPVTIPEFPPQKPSWLVERIGELLDFLGNLLAPLGNALGESWWWLQWVMLAVAVLFALVLLVRVLGPDFWRRGSKGRSADTAALDEWRPDSATSLALLEDADRLAGEGRFNEATHLLLQRSVGQIAAARPDWVDPSSTARELAVLPALPDGARTAFGVIAARVERSLFALRGLDRADWDAARAAYADFALARLDANRRAS